MWANTDSKYGWTQTVFGTVCYLLHSQGWAALAHAVMSSVEVPNRNNRRRPSTADDERGRFCMKAAGVSPDPCQIMADKAGSFGRNQSAFGQLPQIPCILKHTRIWYFWSDWRLNVQFEWTIDAYGSFVWLTFVPITGEKENNSTSDTFCVCCGKQLTRFPFLKDSFTFWFDICLLCFSAESNMRPDCCHVWHEPD